MEEKKLATILEALADKIDNLELGLNINHFDIKKLKEDNERLKKENDDLKADNEKLREVVRVLEQALPKEGKR